MTKALTVVIWLLIVTLSWSAPGTGGISLGR